MLHDASTLLCPSFICSLFWKSSFEESELSLLFSLLKYFLFLIIESWADAELIDLAWNLDFTENPSVLVSSSFSLIMDNQSWVFFCKMYVI